jgi:uncharacterized membrane protein YhaH (DUF805 family)
MSWYLTALKKYATFEGRARRKEYWMFILFNLVFTFVAIIVDSIITSGSDGNSFGIFYALYTLAVFLPSLAVMVRRLHDIGKSGWWVFISLIPFLGAIWLFILLISDSQPGENPYGLNPKMSS